jgi:hypothetical protein
MMFKDGERVIYIINSKVYHGVITYLANIETAIVQSDDGQRFKVPFKFLAPEPIVEKTEPIEKPEITITPEEFRETAVKVFTELGVIPQSSVYDVTVFTAELHKALFFNEINENP